MKARLLIAASTLTLLSSSALAIAPAPTAGSLGPLPLIGLALLGTIAAIRFFKSKND